MTTLLGVILFNKLWYALPLIVVISLVYAATKHELWPNLIRSAWQTGVWLFSFLLIVFVVLFLVSWGL